MRLNLPLAEHGAAAARERPSRRAAARSRSVLGLVILSLATPLDAGGQQSYRVRGASEAPVELTIYSDFECPYCRNFALAAIPAITAEFVDRGLLRLRYVFFPLASIHRNAVASAKAAHCAGTAGRFWSYHDYLYVRQPEWAGPPAPDSLWVTYAVNLGIDSTTFRQCFAAAETNTAVESDLREALASGATGTPTIVLGDQSLSGLSSYEELRQQIVTAIEMARREKPPEVPPPRRTP